MKHIRRNTMLLLISSLLLMSCGADKYMKKGEKFLALGEYYDAADQFITSCTSPLMRAMISPLRSSLKKPSERLFIFW